jgi:hypothetical protein
LANICARRCDFAGQLQWAQKAASCDRKSPEPYFAIASAYIRIDQLKNAEEVLDKIIRLKLEHVGTTMKKQNNIFGEI